MNQVVLVLLFYAAGSAQGSGELWLSICRNEGLGGFNYSGWYVPPTSEPVLSSVMVFVPFTHIHCHFSGN